MQGVNSLTAKTVTFQARCAK